jgi:2-methylcitrate dehydratase PrpD
MNPSQAPAPTRRIAEWVAGVSVERTAQAHVLAIEGIRDVLGCAIAGCGESAVRDAAVVATSWGPGRASIVGRAACIAAPGAAFVNGAAAHILDFDDSFAPLTGHPSAVLVPAILALAQERGLTGAAVLDAYVVGIEVVAALGRMMNPAHYMAGWHATATLGVFGAAAAASRLLKLPADGVAAALSNAFSFCSGSRNQLGYAMKSIQAGVAARDGLVAAALAEQGLGGNPEVLAGTRGLVRLYDGREAGAQELAMPGAGGPLAIVDPGLTFKPYPTCGSTHRTLDALLDLREKHAIDADRVKKVEVIIPALNVNNLTYATPARPIEAKFSMHYCAAVALVQGAVGLGDFHESALHRPEMRRLMARIDMRALPGSEHTDKDYLELPAITIVEMEDGMRHEDTRYHRRGSADAPMPERAHRAKFSDCAATVLSPSRAARLQSSIEALESVTNIATFMDALRGA